MNLVFQFQFDHFETFEYFDVFHFFDQLVFVLEEQWIVVRISFQIYQVFFDGHFFIFGQ